MLIGLDSEIFLLKAFVILLARVLLELNWIRMDSCGMCSASGGCLKPNTWIRFCCSR